MRTRTLLVLLCVALLVLSAEGKKKRKNKMNRDKGKGKEKEATETVKAANETMTAANETVKADNGTTNETLVFTAVEEKKKKKIIFRGSSGEVCTEDERHCITDASCKNNECECPAGHKGDGYITCVNEDELLCKATLVPDIVTYDGCRATLPLPCRHRLTYFTTRCAESEGSLGSYGSFEVFGLNAWTDYGAVYEKGVEVVLSRGEMVNGDYTAMNTAVLRLTDDDLYRYTRYGGDTPSLFGWLYNRPANIREWYGYSYFDPYDNFAVIWSPDCNTTIRFRPFNYSADNPVQRFMPGITIQVPGKAKPHRVLGLFPSSLCGWPVEGMDAYQQLVQMRHLGRKNAALTYSVLMNHVNQNWTHVPERGKYEKECNDAETLIKNCYCREQAIACCEGILDSSNIIKCLMQNGRNVMDTFNFCLGLCCFKTDRACWLLYSDIHPCLDLMPDDLKKLQCPEQETTDQNGTEDSEQGENAKKPERTRRQRRRPRR